MLISLAMLISFCGISTGLAPLPSVLAQQDPLKKTRDPGFSSDALKDGTKSYPELADITSSTGIEFQHLSNSEQKYIVESMSGGVALIDYDGDGWPDIYFTNAPSVEMALRNFIKVGGGTRSVVLSGSRVPGGLNRDGRFQWGFGFGPKR
jgi:hypothetical protein